MISSAAAPVRIEPPLWLRSAEGALLQAIFLIDRGMDYDLEWVCIRQQDGAIVSLLNPAVRAVENYTTGRPKPLEGTTFHGTAQRKQQR